jgi:hypothetical protein
MGTRSVAKSNIRWHGDFFWCVIRQLNDPVMKSIVRGLYTESITCILDACGISPEFVCLFAFWYFASQKWFECEMLCKVTEAAGKESLAETDRKKKAGQQLD